MLDWTYMREVWRRELPSIDRLAREADVTESFAQRLLKALAGGEHIEMNAVHAEKLRAIGWLPPRFIGPEGDFIEAKRARIRQLAADAKLPAAVGEAFAEAVEAIVAREDAILRNQMTNLQAELSEKGDAVEALRIAGEIDRKPELSRLIVGQVLGNATIPTWSTISGLRGVVAELQRIEREAVPPTPSLIGGRAGGRTSKKVGETARNSAGGSVAPAGRQSRSGKR